MITEHQNSPETPIIQCEINMAQLVTIAWPN